MIYFFLFSLIKTVFSSSCGESLIPFSFETLSDGQPVLGCARPLCFGWQSTGQPQPITATFFRINHQPDGFVRNDVSSIPPFDNADQLSRQTAKCEKAHQSTSCSLKGQWVGGIVPLLNVSSYLTAYQCCTSKAALTSIDRGVATVNPGQIVIGGEIYENDVLSGFDYINNIEKVVNDNGSVYYNVNIRRMECSSSQYFVSQPNVEKKINKVAAYQVRNLATEPILIANSIEESIVNQQSVENVARPSPPPPNLNTESMFYQTDPIPNQRIFYNSEQSNYQSFYCFTGDTNVQLIDGSIKRMEQLKINDWVLTIGKAGFIYIPVSYWIHRNSEIEAPFRRILLEDGTELKITDKHQIYKTNCLKSGIIDWKNIANVTVDADQIEKGDCLYKFEKNSLKIIKVKEIQKIKEKGIFSPMTTTGTIIVNNIYASCHSSINNQQLQSSFFSHVNHLNVLLENLFENSWKRDIPFGMATILEMIDLILPKNII